MPVYQEVQRFRQKWLWAFLLLLFALFSSQFYRVFAHHRLIPRPLLLPLLANGAIPVLLLLLFWKARLEVRFDRGGLNYRFFPFQLRERSIRWEEVGKAYPRTYRPIMEYGGWGIRTNWNGRNVAYNVSGDRGLQLELKNGRRVLFGTARPDELAAALNSLGRF
ncbi:MAG: hypothetical protein BWY73_01182 [candidate division TA06 bacterium ADurb.Bin417]|uniref:Bacterial Pleckstrin homology domain-containing protein n=1 Tax=candidate division TA06 bacterium ADurb.Bin417 TaxID=1852828 RepID=A0A1V5MCZ2_UNCT6|nr:MAG: hypothetical protein BWY73_01182 [candidate division TA06 bacterium ADurb.Bin417]